MKKYLLMSQKETKEEYSGGKLELGIGVVTFLSNFLILQNRGMRGFSNVGESGLEFRNQTFRRALCLRFFLFVRILGGGGFLSSFRFLWTFINGIMLHKVLCNFLFSFGCDLDIFPCWYLICDLIVISEGWNKWYSVGLECSHTCYLWPVLGPTCWHQATLLNILKNYSLSLLSTPKLSYM